MRPRSNIFFMDQLIPLAQAENGETLVNLRDLYRFLEVKSDFTTWVKRRIKAYDFKEGRDYMSSHVKNVDIEAKNAWLQEYNATISMAKQLTMVENNKRGREAREYFIAIEEEFRSQKREVPQLTPAQMFLESAKLLNNHEDRLKAIENAMVYQENNAQEARDAIKSLPGPSVELQAASTRQLLLERINYYVASTKGAIKWQDAWRMLYQKAVYRLNVHFTKAANKGETKLDQIERKGKLDLLYALACEMFPIG